MDEIPVNEIIERTYSLPDSPFPSSFSWICNHGESQISIASIDPCCFAKDVFELENSQLVPIYIQGLYEQFANHIPDAEKIQLSYNPIYWFSRLSIYRNMRGQGWGTKFMEKITQTADKYEIHIINGVNPYSEMTLDETIRFYKKHGFFNFDNTNKKDALFRLAKTPGKNYNT